MSINVDNLTVEEMEALEIKLRERKAKARERQAEAYTELRTGFMAKMKDRVYKESSEIEAFANYVRKESTAFLDIMKEYGQVRRAGQMSYILVDGTFKLEVKTNKVKKFDERADLAAERLIEFLRNWIQSKEKGTEDPLYQLAMTFIERDSQGNLDYKQISKLYSLEEKFNSEEYSSIMQLFKESHTVESTATHYYFYEKDEFGVWRKIEISFNRF